MEWRKDGGCKKVWISRPVSSATPLPCLFSAVEVTHIASYEAWFNYVLAQREVYNNYTSYFLTSGGFTVTQNNTVVSNTSNVASDAYGKF